MMTRSDILFDALLSTLGKIERGDGGQFPRAIYLHPETMRDIRTGGRDFIDVVVDEGELRTGCYFHLFRYPVYSIPRRVPVPPAYAFIPPLTAGPWRPLPQGTPYTLPEDWLYPLDIPIPTRWERILGPDPI